jgi:hypothetical protein
MIEAPSGEPIMFDNLHSDLGIEDAHKSTYSNAGGSCLFIGRIANASPLAEEGRFAIYDRKDEAPNLLTFDVPAIGGLVKHLQMA